MVSKSRDRSSDGVVQFSSPSYTSSSNKGPVAAVDTHSEISELFRVLSGSYSVGSEGGTSVWGARSEWAEDPVVMVNVP